jgi:hypothetical protein
MIIQITGPNFCAAVIIKDNRVCEAAPILKWALGQSKYYIMELKDRYKVRIIETIGDLK